MNPRRVEIPLLNPTTCLTQVTENFNNGGGENRNIVSQQNLMLPISSQIPTGSSTFNLGSSLLHTMSKPTHVFTFDSLLPLSPSSTSLCGSTSAQVAGYDGKNSTLPPVPFMMSNPSMASDSTLPPRITHRRANSDNLSELDSMIIPHNSQKLTSCDELEHVVKGFTRGESSCPIKDLGERKSEEDGLGWDKYIFDNIDLDFLDDLDNNDHTDDVETHLEGEIVIGSTSSGVKRRATIEMSPLGRHQRSFSDSYFNGIESSNLPPFPTSSVTGNQNVLNLRFERGKFNASEMETLRTDTRLAEVAVSEPKRVRRILANRQSAARSMVKKKQYILELEKKVETLEAEANTFSAKLTNLEKANISLTNHNKELLLRLEAMEQDGRLRDALNDLLTTKVERLELATGELSKLKANMYEQLNVNQLHRASVDPNLR